MPDDEIDTFELYLHMVYYNEIACIAEPTSGKDIGNFEHVCLARLYVLCEKLQDVKAKNCVVQALMDSIYKKRTDNKWYIPLPPPINIIYKGNVKGSPARQLLLDVFTYSVKAEWLTEPTLDGYPGEFLQELAVNIVTKRPPEVTVSSHLASQNGRLEYLEKEDLNDQP